MTAIWLAAADRQAVTAAAHAIDELLARAPASAGEARTGNTRIYFEPPLVVTFDIIEDDRRVEVLRVSYLAPRP